MPGTSENLHGSAPDSHPVALLLVDVVNAALALMQRVLKAVAAEIDFAALAAG